MRGLDDVLRRIEGIAADFYAGAIDRDTARSALTDEVIDWVDCSSVSLWRFDGAPGSLVLRCFAVKSQGALLANVDSIIRQDEFRAYFDALIETGVYISDDAGIDPTLAPMRRSYLGPFQVRSMLDAAILVNGRAYGMVCCEQADHQRHWRPDEIAGLRAIAARIARVTAAANDPALWGSPSLPLVPLPTAPDQAAPA